MTMSLTRQAIVAATLSGLMLAAPTPVLAQKKSAQEQRAEQVAQIPVCAKPLGSI